MGGLGSGRRWHYSACDTTDNYRIIDVRRWKKAGLLTPSGAFGWQWTLNRDVVASIRVRTELGCVRLIYRHRNGGGDWKDENYPVQLSWTSCHLGGQRPWFRCPARNCGRRVAVLFGGGIFACRQCHRLAYPSQRECWEDRATRRADRIRDKLGWEPGILNGGGLKPKGMHMKTFDRLSARHDDLVEKSIAGMEARFGLKL